MQAHRRVSGFTIGFNLLKIGGVDFEKKNESFRKHLKKKPDPNNIFAIPVFIKQEQNIKISNC